MKSPSDLYKFFCNQSQIKNYVISFHDSTETLQWSLCIIETLYNETYEQFIRQYGRSIQLKVKFQRFFFVLFFSSFCVLRNFMD